tara:strand:- start:42844 stop:43065 length:222 start_codon:yes stop_codon:yes gene_type:complete
MNKADDIRGWFEVAGGQSAVGRRIGRHPSTINKAISEGKLPPAWFSALSEIGQEVGHSVDPAWFGFVTARAAS